MTRKPITQTLAAVCLCLSISKIGAQPSVPLDPEKVKGVPAYQTLKGFKDLVTDVDFSPDSNTVAAVSLDGTLKLWRLEAGKPSTQTTLPQTRFYNVRFSPDGKTLAACDNHKTVKLFDVSTLTLRRELKGHAGNVRSIAYAPDGKTLATTCPQDKTIKLWDPDTGVCRSTFHRTTGSGPSISFLPDGKSLLAARFDESQTVSLLDGQTGLTKARFEHPQTQRLLCMALSPDGKTLVVSTRVTEETLVAAKAAGHPIRNDQWSFLTFWDVQTGKSIRTIPAITDGHSRFSDRKESFFVRSMAFLPDGQTLATAGKHWIYLWNVLDGQPKEPIKAHPKVVQMLRWKRVFLLNPVYIGGFAVSPDGTRIAEGFGCHAMPKHQTVMPAVGPKTNQHPGWKARGEVNLWRLP